MGGYYLCKKSIALAILRHISNLKLSDITSFFYFLVLKYDSKLKGHLWWTDIIDFSSLLKEMPKNLLIQGNFKF